MPIKVTDAELAELQAKLGGIPTRTPREAVTKKRNAKSEENLQLRVCKYLRETWPSVHFVCDYAAGLKLTKQQAIKAAKMRSADKLPDVLILASRGEFSGLLIELKAEGKLRLKSGQISGSAHIQAQAERLAELRQEGYKAEFAEGFYEAVDLIAAYMKLPRKEVAKPSGQTNLFQ